MCIRDSLRDERNGNAVGMPTHCVKVTMYCSILFQLCAVSDSQTLIVLLVLSVLLIRSGRFAPLNVTRDGRRLLQEDV
eukprot:4632687-Amphidinium_carterae.1